jgi:replicative DNA helicase
MAEKQYYNKKKYDNTASIAEQYGKVPPQATDIEETILGALMLEKDAIFSVIDILKPEIFYKEAHSKIYKAVIALSIDHKPIDIHTVSEQLRLEGNLDDIGGPYVLAQLTNKVASTAHLEFHSRIIAQKYIQRELIRVGAEIQRKAFEEAEDVADMLDSAENELFQIAEGNIKKEVSVIKDVLRDSIQAIEDASKKPDGLSGVPSGFTELDRMTSGWQPSDMVVIAARPAMGKTAFVLSLARNTTVTHKQGVAVFSLEMSAVQLVNRIVSMEAEISGEQLKKGALKDWEWQQLETRIKNLYDAPLYIDDTPALSVFELRAKLRRLVMQHGVKLAIIDYLQLMTAAGTQSREQEVSTISRSIKAIAKELNIPILALSQLNRSVEARAGDKRPQLSDLRESGAIEQDADMVMFIHRPEYYKITEDEQGNSLMGVAEIIVAKHRSGSVGDVRLRFVKEFTRFQDLETEFTLPDEASMSEGGAMTFQSKINDDSGTNSAAPKEPSNDFDFSGGGFDGGDFGNNGGFDDNSPAPF